MTQISIQVDDNTLATIKTIAAKKHTSVPAWIKSCIDHRLKDEWPDDYLSVFGALNENDLEEPPEIVVEKPGFVEYNITGGS